MLLEPTDAKSGKALSTKDAVILLDTEITDELYNEGIVRDFVRAIQQARKDQDFNITDKINIRINAEKQIFGEILLGAKNYIEEQTLSTFAITQESYHNDIILDNVKIQFELLKI
jgi:isoleucyl-tRNA synthetase